MPVSHGTTDANAWFYGRNPTVPSLLPRNYALGLITYLAAVWLTAIAIALGASVAARRRGGRR